MKPSLLVPLMPPFVPVQPLFLIHLQPVQRFPHLAALRHLEAVQGVAMRTEETSHEVVTPAVFATRLVKLLPPILVVASVFVDRDDLPSVAFAWLGAGGLRKVVQSISCAPM